MTHALKPPTIDDDPLETLTGLLRRIERRAERVTGQEREWLERTFESVALAQAQLRKRQQKEKAERPVGYRRGSATFMYEVAI